MSSSQFISDCNGVCMLKFHDGCSASWRKCCNHSISDHHNSVHHLVSQDWQDHKNHREVRGVFLRFSHPKSKLSMRNTNSWGGGQVRFEELLIENLGYVYAYLKTPPSPVPGPCAARVSWISSLECFVEPVHHFFPSLVSDPEPEAKIHTEAVCQWHPWVPHPGQWHGLFLSLL